MSGAPKVSIITVVRNRPDALERTIENVASMRYDAIEHVLIDGDSSDRTREIVAAYAGEAGYVVKSEADFGIYDAINKGLAAATGDYLCVLHAGDLYEPDFVARAVEAAEARPGAIVYAGHRSGDRLVEADEVSQGLLLHPLGVNHQTFLTPRAVQDRIGPYPAETRIVGDHVWTRRAFLSGVPFHRIAGHPLSFEPGGASSATTPEQRALVIGENVAAYRAVFPFLSVATAERIYTLRFSDEAASAIATYLETVDGDPDLPAAWTQFRDALRAALRHIWARRPLAPKKSAEAAAAVEGRLCLARALGIDLVETGIAGEGVDVADLCAEIDALAARLAGEPPFLHYLEVFSRPSETFIPDLIGGLASVENAPQVVLCDKRVLAEERPAEHLFAFDHPRFPEAFSRAVIDRFLERLAPAQFVFHFAINGWRFLDRVEPRWRMVPALFMTHGVDVYDLDLDTPYSRWARRELPAAPRTRLTAASAFLRGRLVEAGVPADRVTLAHNVAHPRFFENRRSGVERAAARAEDGGVLRLLNIGRLVPVKGHATLIRALARLVRDHAVPARLTIVYGGEAALLEEMRALAAQEGVADAVAFVERVDLEADPGFLHGFDLFVQGSTQVFDGARRAEAFGLATLEAIASGLPVVVTDAGGQPEVVGDETRFARIAPHDDPAAFAAAIADIAGSGALEQDNLAYARERLARFSAEGRIAAVRGAIADSREAPLSVALFSAAVDGGAGGAANRVHRALRQVGVASSLVCRYAPPEGREPPALRRVSGAPRSITDGMHPTGRFLHQGHTIFSIDTDGLPDAALDEIVAEADVVSLHWYARFLSNANVARLLASGKPVVFTIRDMYPLSGGCHFFHGCENWKAACHPCPQFLPEGLGAPRDALLWKRRNWDLRNATIVVLSEQTRRIVAESPLFAGVRVEKIPNPIDLETFRPRPAAEARAALGAPLDKRILAYLPSYRSTVKGAKEMGRALEALARRVDPGSVALLCAGAGAQGLDTPFETIDLGRIDDPERLALFYAAADLLVAPSLEETFSNTVAEALACGSPVVGFDVGAIPELAANGRGETVTAGDSIALALVIERWLDRADPATRARCRAHVEQTLAPDRIGRRYRDLFAELAASARPVEAPPAPPEDARTRYLALRLAAAATAAPQGASDKAAAPRLPALGGDPVDLLPAMRMGAGVSLGRGGAADCSVAAAGHRLFGPYLPLAPGDYRLSATLRGPLTRPPSGARAPVLEAAWNGDAILAQADLPPHRWPFGKRTLHVDFAIDPETAAKADGGFEARIWTDGARGGRIEALSLERRA